LSTTKTGLSETGQKQKQPDAHARPDVGSTIRFVVAVVVAGKAATASAKVDL